MPPAVLNPETRFGPGAWVTLALALLLVAAGAVVLAYRFSLPTDGWKLESLEGGEAYRALENVMGAASELQPGDEVVAVGGVPVRDWDALAALERVWAPGVTVTYTVVRAGQRLEVDVTVTRWQFSQWLLATLRNPGETAYLVASYLLFALSGVVFWRRPGNPAARAFFLLNAALVAADSVTGTLTMAWPEAIDPLARRISSGRANGLIYGVLLPSVVLRFALVFPRPKPSLLRRPWLAHVPAAFSLALLALTPQDSPALWLWFVASILLMLTILAHNAVTMRDAVSRAQLMWGLGGLIIGFGLLAGLLLAGTLNLAGLREAHFDVGGAAALGVIGLTLSIAILRYRLFDIDVIIRRTLTYSVLTGLLALAYFGSVVVLQGVFRALTGQGQSSLAVVLSTLAMAALFGPLRARVQAAIDRRFYRRKYDAAQTLAAFAAGARDETDLEQLTGRLVDVVEDALQPSAASLWLRPPGSQRTGR